MIGKVQGDLTPTQNALGESTIGDVIADAQLAATERWTAILSVVIDRPRTEERLRKNPLGIYVNGLSWSKELGSN